MKEIKFNEIRFRASKIGSLMTKTPLTEGVQNYLIELYYKLAYNREKIISTDAMIKGNLVEDSNIELYSDYCNAFPSYKKNEIRLFNEYFEGTCDVLTDDKIIDIKSSESIFTKPNAVTYKRNKAYEYQGQVYMNLYNRKFYTIAYVLANDPLEQIEKELHYLQYKNISDTERIRQMKQIELNSIVDPYQFKKDYPDYVFMNEMDAFEEILIEKRIFEDHFEYDENKVLDMQDRVLIMREWMAENYRNF